MSNWTRSIATAWWGLLLGFAATHVVRRGPPDAVNPSAVPPVSGTCASLRLAEVLSGVPITQDEPQIEYGRDRYFVQTRIGRFVTDVFYKNETRLQDRGQALQVRDEDRALAQALYAKYVGDAKLLLANPSRRDVVLTQQVMNDAEAAFAAGKHYLRDDEVRAADALADLARARARIGMTASDGLEILDDETLFRQVKAIGSTIGFLDTDV